MRTYDVDFKAVKASVGMLETLARYGVKLERGKKGWRGDCPLPSHQRAKGTLSVDDLKNFWACHESACAASREGKKGGDVILFVAQMEKCGLRQAALKLVEWFGNGAKAESVPPAKEEPQAASVDGEQLVYDSQNEEATKVVNKPLGFELRGIDPSHPYLAERGIEKETAERFGVGFFPGKGSMAGRIVFPIHNWEGQLVAYAGRSLDGAEPRYKFPMGFHKSHEIWNLHAVRFRPDNSPVILVEGFFDCLRVSAAGFACVALMGCQMSDAQEASLARFRSIVLMLDGDEPGRKATAEISARIVHTSFVRVVDLPGVQPDELSTEEIRKYLEHVASPTSS